MDIPSAIPTIALVDISDVSKRKQRRIVVLGLELWIQQQQRKAVFDKVRTPIGELWEMYDKIYAEVQAALHGSEGLTRQYFEDFQRTFLDNTAYQLLPNCSLGRSF